jgi:hypothetical protein
MFFSEEKNKLEASLFRAPEWLFMKIKIPKKLPMT